MWIALLATGVFAISAVEADNPVDWLRAELARIYPLVLSEIAAEKDDPSISPSVLTIHKEGVHEEGVKCRVWSRHFRLLNKGLRERYAEAIERDETVKNLVASMKRLVAAGERCGDAIEAALETLGRYEREYLSTQEAHRERLTEIDNTDCKKEPSQFSQLSCVASKERERERATNEYSIAVNNLRAASDAAMKEPRPTSEIFWDQMNKTYEILTDLGIDLK